MPSMTTAQDVAKTAAESFETRTRYEGEPGRDAEDYTTLKDDAPEWVRELVYDAHGDMLPEDWRYACIRAAVDHIAEGSEDGDDFADSYVDVYTSARFDWLASHLSRAGYVDEAAEELGAESVYAEGIIGAVGVGQYFEAREVFGLVLASLEARAEEVYEEEDAAETFGEND